MSSSAPSTQERFQARKELTSPPDMNTSYNISKGSSNVTSLSITPANTPLVKNPVTKSKSSESKENTKEILRQSGNVSQSSKDTSETMNSKNIFDLSEIDASLNSSSNEEMNDSKDVKSITSIIQSIDNKDGSDDYDDDDEIKGIKRQSTSSLVRRPALKRRNAFTKRASLSAMLKLKSPLLNEKRGTVIPEAFLQHSSDEEFNFTGQSKSRTDTVQCLDHKMITKEKVEPLEKYPTSEFALAEKFSARTANATEVQNLLDFDSLFTSEPSKQNSLKRGRSCYHDYSRAFSNTSQTSYGSSTSYDYSTTSSEFSLYLRRSCSLNSLESSSIPEGSSGSSKPSFEPFFPSHNHFSQVSARYSEEFSSGSLPFQTNSLKHLGSKEQRRLSFSNSRKAQSLMCDLTSPSPLTKQTILEIFEENNYSDHGDIAIESKHPLLKETKSLPESVNFEDKNIPLEDSCENSMNDKDLLSDSGFLKAIEQTNLVIPPPESFAKEETERDKFDGPTLDDFLSFPFILAPPSEFSSDHEILERKKSSEANIPNLLKHKSELLLHPDTPEKKFKFSKSPTLNAREKAHKRRNFRRSVKSFRISEERPSEKLFRLSENYRSLDASFTFLSFADELADSPFISSEGDGKESIIKHLNFSGMSKNLKNFTGDKKYISYSKHLSDSDNIVSQDLETSMSLQEFLAKNQSSDFRHNIDFCDSLFNFLYFDYFPHILRHNIITSTLQSVDGITLPNNSNVSSHVTDYESKLGFQAMSPHQHSTANTSNNDCLQSQETASNMESTQIVLKHQGYVVQHTKKTFIEDDSKTGTKSGPDQTNLPEAVLQPACVTKKKSGKYVMRHVDSQPTGSISQNTGRVKAIKNKFETADDGNNCCD